MYEMYALIAAICVPISFAGIMTVRVLILIYQIYASDGRLSTTEYSLPTMICIGSGGHTTEMLRIVSSFKSEKYQPRLYIVADNDANSESKIHKLESNGTHYSLRRIPRSRNVNQSYISSVFSTVNAMFHTFPIVFHFKPALVLCNGPGTCIPVCIAAFVLRCLYLTESRIVFIESICRVRSMSLTGMILQYIADVVIVQWPQLRDICFRAKYFGKLT